MTVSVPSGAIRAVRNSTDDTWPSPMPRTLSTHRRCPRGTPSWSGVRDQRRVAQRRALHRVFVGEVRADQHPPRFRQFHARVEAVADAREVVGEALPQVAVPPREQLHRAGQRHLRGVLVQRHHPPDHPRGPGLVLGLLLARHEQPGDDPARVRPQPHPTAGDQGAHPALPVNTRACWRVESSASVDSAPWLRLRPSRDRPSHPPPVSSSSSGTLASLSPPNPRHRAPDAGRPRPVAGHPVGAGAGVGERGGFERLLIERRAVLTGAPAVHGRGREPVAGGDERFGQHGVGVEQARFRPRPRHRPVRPAHDGGDVRQEFPRRLVVGLGAQHLGRAQRGEAHRAPRRPGSSRARAAAAVSGRARAGPRRR